MTDVLNNLEFDWRAAAKAGGFILTLAVPFFWRFKQGRVQKAQFDTLHLERERLQHEKERTEQYDRAVSEVRYFRQMLEETREELKNAKIDALNGWSLGRGIEVFAHNQRHIMNNDRQKYNNLLSLVNDVVTLKVTVDQFRCRTGSLLFMTEAPEVPLLKDVEKKTPEEVKKYEDRKVLSDEQQLIASEQSKGVL